MADTVRASVPLTNPNAVFIDDGEGNEISTSKEVAEALGYSSQDKLTYDDGYQDAHADATMDSDEAEGEPEPQQSEQISETPDALLNDDTELVPQRLAWDHGPEKANEIIEDASKSFTDEAFEESLDEFAVKHGLKPEVAHEMYHEAVRSNSKIVTEVIGEAWVDYFGVMRTVGSPTQKALIENAMAKQARGDMTRSDWIALTKQFTKE
jgi:hypothetical protein